MAKQTLADELRSLIPQVWINPSYASLCEINEQPDVRFDDVDEAQSNWKELAPLLAALFKELKQRGGDIDSELVDMGSLIEDLGCRNSQGSFFIKADHTLPVAGSVKARGGIYETCMYARSLARDLGLLSKEDPITKLIEEPIRAAFSRHTIAVGSTGNLGLSVGVAARALGFKAVVHMSSDAKPWKVDRLRKLGVHVVEHQADYGTAVRMAREQAVADKKVYFVDDESSKLLFLGYSKAAFDLKAQLDERDIQIGKERPLLLFLPCGIGGAPGGITFGAKKIFGDSVHCFFVEPVQSPCALLGIEAGPKVSRSVYDIGLTNKTEADGMAVAEMSQLVCRLMHRLVAGVITVSDEELLKWVFRAHHKRNMRLEPSAASGFAALSQILQMDELEKSLLGKAKCSSLANAVHVVWTTGGDLLPPIEHNALLDRGNNSQ